jgi:hypothetical protein
MSESTFCLKAQFPTPESADTARTETFNFLLQMARAYKYYQGQLSQLPKRKDRFGHELPYRKSDSPSIKGFKFHFPEVWKALQEGYPDEKFTVISDLSRKLDYGQVESDIDTYLNVDDNVLSYQMYEVGGLSQWFCLSTYLKSLGAIKVVWGDGNDSLDTLQLWPWEDIVHAILTKADLPTLIGIHPELDQLISPKLKGR